MKWNSPTARGLRYAIAGVALVWAVYHLAGGAMLLFPALGDVFGSEPDFRDPNAVSEFLAEEAAATWTNSPRGACAFPPNLPPQADMAACCGGMHCTPKDEAVEAWKSSELSPQAPSVFVYSTKTTTTSNGETRYLVSAKADITCGGPVHTFHTWVIGTRDADGACKAKIEPTVIENEFE